mmetsp:Transcript_53953/g.136287  ORF Transcript_53953/g.136287 Transcript_53953/m.136287 type:complete len:249 (+) Transcript_53953:616-1362(+)
MHQRSPHDIARDFVPCIASRVLTQDGDQALPVLRHPVLKNVLQDKIAEGMPGKPGSLGQQLLNQPGRHAARAVLQQPLQDAATLLMLSRLRRTAGELLDDELQALWGHAGDQFLQHVVAMRGSRGFPGMTSELVDQLDTDAIANPIGLHGKLQKSRAAGRRCERERALRQALQVGTHVEGGSRVKVEADAAAVDLTYRIEVELRAAEPLEALTHRKNRGQRLGLRAGHGELGLDRRRTILCDAMNQEV